MIIEGHDVNKKVFIIAEIGNNHEGNFDVAQEMIIQAAEAGADAVKFQTIVPELLVSVAETERIAKLKKFQFSHSQFEALANLAATKNIVFFSTPFDLGSASFLNTIQSVFKIASGDNNFFPLIEKIAGFNKPMIISTGLSDIALLEDLYQRVSTIRAKFKNDPGFAFMHCVTSYPVPDSESNLASISYLKKHFPAVTIGYSDHTIGIKAAIYAVAVGARIIEKHFTIDNNYSDFRDHQLSANPEDMRKMVDGIREAELMIGDGFRSDVGCEKDMHIAARRSIAAAMNLPEGTIITNDHLIWVRPGNGLAPGNELKLLGKRTVRNITSGEMINTVDVFHNN